MAVIGYESALGLMQQQGWLLHVTMRGESLQGAELHHPQGVERHTGRRDSAKKLIPKCEVCGRVNDETAVLCCG